MRNEIDNDQLAEFHDAITARYIRFYPVEIARVWRAVTDSDALNAWLYPVTKVEPRLGGACTFSWGAPEDPTAVGWVSRFEAMKQVRYELSRDNYIQIDLAPVEGGTRFTFTQYFGPGFRHANDGQLEEREGAQPAGPGTPWRAGFLAGFHINFAFLQPFLVEDWSMARIESESRRCVAGTNAGEYTAAFSESDGEWERLVDIYYNHIERACPKKVS